MRMLLLQVQPHVDHTWVRVGKAESDLDEALLAAIQSDPDYAAGRARVLVFTRNTANADRVSGPGCRGVWAAVACPCAWGTPAERVWHATCCVFSRDLQISPTRAVTDVLLLA